MKALVKLSTLGAILLVAACSSTTSTTTTSTKDGGDTNADDNGGSGGTSGTGGASGTTAPPPKKDAGDTTSQAEAGSTKPAEVCVPVAINFGSAACNECASTNCCDEGNECAGPDVLVGTSSPCLDFGACLGAALDKFSTDHDGGAPEQADVQAMVQECEAAHAGGGQPYIGLVQCLGGPACKTSCQ